MLSDVVLVLRMVAVFELAGAVVVAVELQMSPGFGQFSFALLLFGSTCRLMLRQCESWLAAHPHHHSSEWHLLYLIVLVTA